MTDREPRSCGTKKFQSRMRAANLRLVSANIDVVDFRTPRKLHERKLKELATGRWIDNSRTLLITGAIRRR